MNLIEDRWIPVRRQNGEEERIAPWELTANFEDNPIVVPATPRPDFTGGLMQFLIGLLQTAAPPDEAAGLEWEDWLEEPPRSWDAARSICALFRLLPPGRGRTALHAGPGVGQSRKGKEEEEERSDRYQFVADRRTS